MELKATDLRIGNYVLDRFGREWVIHELLQEYCRVGTTKDDFEMSFGYCDLMPVKITGDKLIYLGFNKSGDTYEIKNILNSDMNSSLLVSVSNDSVKIELGYEIQINHFKYIHEVQNLIHAL